MRANLPLQPAAQTMCMLSMLSAALSLAAQLVQAFKRISVHRRPLAFWQAALAFTQENDVRANHYNNKNWVLGDVFVTFWALMFGKSPRASEWHTRPDCEIFNCEI